jgi:hypothetical protein
MDEPFDEEVKILAAVEGTCCVVCGQPIREGDKVHVADGPLTLTHLRCIDATSP